MENNIDRFQNITIDNSIVNPSASTYDDNDTPFSLLTWIERVGVVRSIDLYVEEYNDYLKQWRAVKQQQSAENVTTIKNIYINFLKEIVMNYTSDEEKRFIKTVDFTNPIEADTAIPFFVKRIKEIITIIYRNRHESKFQKIKHSLKGSAKSLEKNIFDYIVKYINKETLNSLQFDLPPIEKITRDARITFTELYDVSQSYYDTGYLYTDGDELTLENGDIYVGYYSIIKQHDGMVKYLTGKIPTSESQILDRVDYRKPLSSRVSIVRYGNEHITPPGGFGLPQTAY